MRIEWPLVRFLLCGAISVCIAVVTYKALPAGYRTVVLFNFLFPGLFVIGYKLRAEEAVSDDKY